MVTKSIIKFNSFSGISGFIRAWENVGSSTVTSGDLDRNNEPWFHSKMSGKNYSKAHWFSWNNTTRQLEYDYVKPKHLVTTNTLSCVIFKPLKLQIVLDLQQEKMLNTVNRYAIPLVHLLPYSTYKLDKQGLVMHVGIQERRMDNGATLNVEFC